MSKCKIELTIKDLGDESSFDVSIKGEGYMDVTLRALMRVMQEVASDSRELSNLVEELNYQLITGIDKIFEEDEENE